MRNGNLWSQRLESGEISTRQLYNNYCSLERQRADRENRKPVYMSRDKFRKMYNIDPVKVQRNNTNISQSRHESCPNKRELTTNDKSYDANVVEEDPSEDTTQDEMDLPYISESESIGEDEGEIAPDIPAAPLHMLSKKQRYYLKVGKSLLSAMKNKIPFKIIPFSNFTPRIKHRSVINHRAITNNRTVQTGVVNNQVPPVSKRTRRRRSLPSIKERAKRFAYRHPNSPDGFDVLLANIYKNSLKKKANQPNNNPKMVVASGSTNNKPVMEVASGSTNNKPGIVAVSQCNPDNPDRVLSENSTASNI